jgi:creatinine amidohydrolase
VTQLPLLLSEITREQACAVAAHALLILPTGATEQHGPHLPVGTDSLVIETIARAAAEQVRPAILSLVAPTIAVGSSPHHLPFGGTLSVGTETYYRLMVDLLESAAQAGFRRIFIINGHGGNSELVQLAARDVALRHDLAVGSGSYWTIARDRLIDAGAGRDHHLPGHAGAFETALIAALRPELVREPLPNRTDAITADPPMPRDTFRSEIYGFWQRIDGFTDSPSRSNPEAGRRFLQAAIAGVAEAFRTFYRNTGSIYSEEPA